MRATIAVLPGDGVGPEVVAEAVKVLEATAKSFGHTLDLASGQIGGGAIDATGSPLPAETLRVCRNADAVLFGAVGGPRWSDPRGRVRPEDGLLGLRRELGVFANLRPVRAVSDLADVSALRADRISDVDVLIVRELTGGIYFGARQEATAARREAYDTMRYSDEEVRRVAHVGFRLARERRQRVTSVDKANVLASSRLWRQVVNDVAREYPGVECESMLVDAAAMHLLRRPADFDVLLTENLFGDILADEASMLVGSIGMLPSASLGDGRRGLYEPIHGSAPDLAGRGVANPLGAVLSAAMLVRHSLGWRVEADAIEAAASRVVADGFRTADIATAGSTTVGTAEMGTRIAELVAGASREEGPCVVTQ
ncbi:MAG: 3-isopropylmalate dehydrogenase [Candidatus Bipolaricaulis sp.]|nr:3-isopropylmalate dehydrogenase [Candidatus Bipolaricaulis sp.]